MRIRIPERGAQGGIVAVRHGRARTGGVGDFLLVAVATAPAGGELPAQIEGMAPLPRVECTAQVGAVGETVVDLVAGAQIAVHQPLGQIGGFQFGHGGDLLHRGTRVARQVLHLEAIGEVVLPFDGGGVVLGIAGVAPHQAVEVAAADADGLGDRRAGARIVRNRIIGNPPVAIVVQAQRHAGGAAQAQAQRWRDTHAAELDRLVAARHGAPGAQQVEAQRRVLAQHPVAVYGASVGLGRPDAGLDFGEILVPGRLGDEVDASAGAAAPGKYRIGPLDDVDLFQVEGIARLRAGIAQAVDKRLLAEFWPRMNGRSLAGRPPSPAVIDIPGALRSTASRSLAPGPG